MSIVLFVDVTLFASEVFLLLASQLNQHIIVKHLAVNHLLT
jgi:hypothetical protein